MSHFGRFGDLGGAGMIPRTIIGSLYSKTSWTDLSDFNIFGTAPTVVGGVIRLGNDSSQPLNTCIELKAPVTCDENVDFVATFKCVSLGSSSFGPLLGRKSQNTFFDPSISAQLRTDLTPNQIVFYPQASGTVTGAIATQNVAVANVVANDTLTLTYSQRANVCTLMANNITQGTQSSFSVTGTLTATPNFSVPDVSTFRIFSGCLNGEFDLLALSLTSNQYYRPRVMCIGDSKTAGYDAITIPARWTNLLIPTFGTVDNFGGTGDPTALVLAEMSYLLAAAPTNVILNIGRNDLANGVATGTWQANYQSIVSQLQAAGINVVHLMPIPETVQDQTALTSFINSTYPSAHKIDVTSAWVNGTDLATDGIHPNPAGHTLIANTILANTAMFEA
jgi:lysophospholipase L1-like esterase